MTLWILEQRVINWPKMILNKIFFIALLGVVVPAHAQTVIVENDPCKYFNFTQADEGVPSVDYVPNVDAYGLAVVPADLAGSQPITLPETISFPLSVDLAERLQTNLPDGLELLPNLGEVKVPNLGDTNIPTTNPQLGEIIELANKNNIRMPLITNGYSLTENLSSLYRTICKKNNTLIFSIFE